MPDNLPELRDIHLPEGVSVFPPAYGWGVIVACIIGAWVLWRYFDVLRRKSKKLYARRLLSKIAVDNPIAAAAEISEILRRTCLIRYPEALALSGEQWINFLQSHTQKKLSEELANLLQNAPYMPRDNKDFSVQDAQKLKDFGNQWVGENL